MSAPPLANGQAVFGAANRFGGGSLDASMLQQTAPAMTPEMAAALQVLYPNPCSPETLLVR